MRKLTNTGKRVAWASWFTFWVMGVYVFGKVIPGWLAIILGYLIWVYSLEIFMEDDL